MRHGVLGLVAGVVVFAGRAEASCIDVVARCYCHGAGTVGVVVTEQVDGGTASLRVESATSGLDAGALFTMPSEGGETLGARWLVLDGSRRPVDAAGQVSCEFAPTPLSATAVASAAVSPTCEADLAALGLTQPPCNDTGPRCAVSPALLGPMLVLAWLWRGRRRRS
ncbi:MAG: hypothetical protein Q8L48_19410 [Archangium sp.]|nr:hypothetical protein [Archangium sp.]